MFWHKGQTLFSFLYEIVPVSKEIKVHSNKKEENNKNGERKATIKRKLWSSRISIHLLVAATHSSTFFINTTSGWVSEWVAYAWEFNEQIDEQSGPASNLVPLTDEEKKEGEGPWKNNTQTLKSLKARGPILLLLPLVLVLHLSALWTWMWYQGLYHLWSERFVIIDGEQLIPLQFSFSRLKLPLLNGETCPWPL